MYIWTVLWRFCHVAVCCWMFQIWVVLASQFCGARAQERGTQTKVGLLAHTSHRGTQTIVGLTSHRGTHTIVGLTSHRGTHTIVGLTSHRGTQTIVGLTSHRGTHTIVGLTSHRGTHTIVGLTSHRGTQTIVGLTSHRGTQTIVGLASHRGTQTIVGFTSHRGTQTIVGLASHRGTQTIVGFTSQRGTQTIVGFTSQRGTQTKVRTYLTQGNSNQGGTYIRELQKRVVWCVSGDCTLTSPCPFAASVFPDHISVPVMYLAMCSQVTSVSQSCILPCAPRSHQCPTHVSCHVCPECPSHVSCLVFPDHSSVPVMFFMFPDPAHQWRCGYTLPGRNDCRSFPGEEKLSSLVMEKKRLEFFLSYFCVSLSSPSPSSPISAVERF